MVRNPARFHGGTRAIPSVRTERQGKCTHRPRTLGNHQPVMRGCNSDGPGSPRVRAGNAPAHRQEPQMTLRPVRAACLLSLCAMVAWSMIDTNPAGAARPGGPAPGTVTVHLERAGRRPAVKGLLSAAQKKALGRG